MIPTILTTIVSRLVLQATTTTDPGKYSRMWGSGDWFNAMVQPFLDLLGPIFPLATGLALAGILFIYSGSMALPIVTMIIIGGMLIPFLPPAAQSASLLLMLVGIAFALYSAWMSGGSRV